MGFRARTCCAWKCAQNALVASLGFRARRNSCTLGTGRAFRVSQFGAGVFGAGLRAIRKGGRVVLSRGGGSVGPGEPSDRLACRAMRAEPVCPAFRLPLTFASRSGSSSGAIVPGCSAGPWRFIVSVVGLFGAGHREGRRMRIRRDIPNGAGVEARESSRTRAPKAAVLRSSSSDELVRRCRFAW